MLSQLNRGDEVAILPSERASPTETIAIAQVKYPGRTLIVPSDGKRYFTRDGLSWIPNEGCIVLATDEHRAALKGRSGLVADPLDFLNPILQHRECNPREP